MRLISRSGIGLTIMVALIAIAAIVVGASATVFQSMARQTQLRIDQTKAHYLAQAGVLRAVWKWYTNNDASTTNDVARRWSSINTTVIGNNLFKAGMDSAGADLQSNYAYVVPGIAFVKTVGVQQSNAAANTTLVLTLGAGISVPVGNFLVVYFAMDANGTNPTMLDSRANTYTRRIDCANAANANVVRTDVFSAPVTTALVAGDTITVNWTTNVTAKAMSVAEFSGVDTFDAGAGTSVCANTANAAGNANPAAAMTAVTSQANELIIGAIGVEGTYPGPPADTFTGGTNWITGPPSRTGIGATTAGVIINPEYRIVGATAPAGAFSTANGTITSRDWATAVLGFYSNPANRWFVSGANRRLQYWQIYNMNSANAITLDKVKISWTPAGAELLNDFVLNGVSKWPGGTAANGSTIDLTNTALASGAAWSGANTYIQWNGAVNGGNAVTVTCQFIFSGDTATSDAKTHDVLMWDGLQTTSAGMPGHRVFTVVATGQVNQTTGRYFKVLKSIRAKVSGAPATATAPANPVMEITDWDEEDKNIP